MALSRPPTAFTASGESGNRPSAAIFWPPMRARSFSTWTSPGSSTSWSMDMRTFMRAMASGSIRPLINSANCAPFPWTTRGISSLWKMILDTCGESTFSDCPRKAACPSRPAISRLVSTQKNEPFLALALLKYMKTYNSLSLWLLVLAGAAGAVSGQPFSTNVNPALSYYQAFEHVPDFSPQDRDYLYTNVWSGQKLPARFGELVAEYDTEFRFLRRAAHSTVPCD